MNVRTTALLKPWLCLSIAVCSYGGDISLWACNGSSCHIFFHQCELYIIIYTELKSLVITANNMCSFQCPLLQYERQQSSGVVAGSLSFA